MFLNVSLEENELRKVTKNQQTIIRAYRLGDSSAEEESMISAGKIALPSPETLHASNV